jgi:hypothetical protein
MTGFPPKAEMAGQIDACDTREQAYLDHRTIASLSNGKARILLMMLVR